MKIIPVAAALLAAFLPLAVPAHAEGKITIQEQFGVAFLPFYVIRDQKLIEKHGQAQGVDITPAWVTLSGAAAANDALLSGAVDVASGAIDGAVLLWDRTRGTPQNVKIIASLGSIPTYIVTNQARIKSIKDFTDKDRIALPAAKVSGFARNLQIAAEQEFGPGKYDVLDNITVTLAHPDATAALLTGQTEITAHYTTPPFLQQELKDPKMHKVLDTYQVLGGPTSLNVAYATEKFRATNPKTYAAFYAALEEAMAWINANKKEAAQTYVRVTQSKVSVESVLEIIEDPDVRFILAPEASLQKAAFLSRIGAIKASPTSWKDFSFPEVQKLPGS